MEIRIHFDHVMQNIPNWRNILLDVLQKNLLTTLPEYLFLQAYSPSTAHLLACCVEYVRCGQQTYCIGPKFQRMFADSECGRVPEDYFKLPHDCFFIAMPKSKWRLYGGPRTEFHFVDGMYVCKRAGNRILFMIWGSENDKAAMPGDDITFWMQFNLNEMPRYTDNDGTTLLDFESYLENILDPKYREKNDILAQMEGLDSLYGCQDVPIILRTAINLILYLASDNPDIRKDYSRRNAKSKQRKLVADLKKRTKKAKKIRKAEKQLETMSEAVVIWIGKKIEKDPAIPEHGGSGGRGKGSWLYRKGHWNYFWVGKRRFTEDGKRIGERRIAKYIAPQYRRMDSIVISKSRQYRFWEEREEYE